MAIEVIKIIEELVGLGEYEYAKRASDKALVKEPGSNGLRRLQALSNGLLGNHCEARENYRRLFYDTHDELDLANYITALFATGDYARAFRVAGAGIESMSNESVALVAETVSIAIEDRDVTFQELPAKIKAILSEYVTK